MLTEIGILPEMTMPGTYLILKLTLKAVLRIQLSFELDPDPGSGLVRKRIRIQVTSKGLEVDTDPSPNKKLFTTIVFDRFCLIYILSFISY